MACRFMMAPNKRGRVPSLPAYHLVTVADGENQQPFADYVRRKKHSLLIMPAVVTPASDYGTGRFLAKVGLEFLALKCADVPGWNNHLVENPELDAIREYARYGKPGIEWPVSIRKIYEPGSFS
jgi:hypothetical protein